ncbi:fibronectin type III domain-containing protein [Psychroserpens ponticola]|uniref:M12 family metallo-peptidase n=1 Tax=Psychroserpens ponticola TaxID=2932268 RepID=A0ABY7RV86_9FLAO|nr:zinc-dependent metalloprotease family protein [Psychroserpens ponticola]WCO01027.1 M12 family metallo-peptidase [Psychroserpens ponticola]
MRKTSLVIAFLLLCCNVFAQKNVWEKTIISTTQKQIPDQPQKSIQFRLNAQQFIQQISSVPSRFSVKQSQVIIELPNENGILERYYMYEASNFHPELAAKFPSIKSYIAKGIKNNAIARISYAPSQGIQVAIANLNRETILIKPLDLKKNIYSVFSRSELNNRLTDFECATIDEYSNRTSNFDSGEQRNADDGNLRLYRAAISTTGEFSQFFQDGTEVDDQERKAKVLAAINTSLTRINGIFERDFSVTMQLIANNEDVIFLNPATDPYSIDNGILQNTLDSTIGDANYDVGHLFGYENNIYGNAGCIACVCTPGQKGSGYTVHSAPDSDHFNIIASHEFGHQFGGWHVQSNFNCRSSNELQEVEPGSGSTIMGYAGICPANVQNESDDYFNYVDIRDIAEWTINGSSCAQIISTANEAPTANAGNDFIIPISTAFILEGQGTDVDNNMLSFCWEENDPENPFSDQPPSPTRVQGPMFRSKLPDLNPNRYMPQIDDVIIGNITPTWEVVPSIGRTMDFVLTVRDNAIGGGQTASDEMTVTVDATSGPFTVTSQSVSETWDVGNNITINWEVAGTNIAPINATEVDILLSIDGGYTYPFTLIENTLNDGTQTILIPNVPTTSQGRIMVRASNNIFYALNSSDINIQTSEFLMNFSDSAISICQPNDAVYNFTYNTILGFTETTTFSAEGLPNGASITFNPTSASEDNIDVEVVISNSQNIDLGNHNIIIKGNSASIEKSSIISLSVYNNTINSPNLTYPLDGETGIDLNDNLTWQEDVNASSYEIQVATDVNFNTIIADLEVFSNSHAVSELDYNTTYFWRVRSRNECGLSNYSNPYSFVTFCIAPSNLMVTTAFTNALEISWIENGSATSWEVEVVPSGDSPTGTGTLVSSNPYTHSGLSSLTSYDIYVRSICSVSNVSGWVGPISFITPADFCNGNHFYDSGGENGNYTDGENSTTIIAPSDGFNSVTVTFNSFQLEGCCDALRVYDGLDINAPLLGQYTGTTNPGPFTSNNPSGALTFWFTSDSSVTFEGWDATVICESISCPNPTNLLVSNVTTSSADLSWTAGSDETAWEIEYGLVGFIQGTGTVLQVTNNPFSLTGLDYNTGYDYYIRANCGINPGDDDSSWIGPIAFTTQNINPPGYLTAVLSDQELGTVDLNWGEPSGIVGRWLLNFDHSCNNNYSQAEIVFNSDGTFSVPPDGVLGVWELIGDQISWTFDNNGFQYFGTLTGSHMEGITSSNGCWFADFISVDYNFQIILGELMINGEPSENANTLYTINSNSLAFIEYNVYRDGQVIAVTSETTYIDTLPDYGIYDYYVTAIYDEGESQPSNVETVEWVSCLEPSDLLVSNITTSSADLSWTAGSDETAWEIEYGLVGFIQGAGTVLQVTNNPFSLTGLDYNTGYDYYIRANCGINPGDDDSSWIGPIAFTTQNINPPGYLTAVLSDQELGTVDLNWGEPSSIVGRWLLNFDHNCNNSYSQVEMIFLDGGTFNIPSEGNSGTWELIGNQITWTFDDTGFQYFGTLTGNHMEGTTSSNGCWFADFISVDYNFQVIVGELMSNGEPSENANTLYTINSNSLAFIEYNVYRDGQVIAVTSETTYIDTLPDYGIYDYYVTAIYDEGESQPSNVETVEWVSCLEPSDLLVSNITTSSADLSWTAGSDETAWEIEYGLVGFIQGTGTVLQVTNNPFSVMGLDSNTEYDYYIRANCGVNPGDDDSSWVGPISFTTLFDFCNGDHFYDSGGENGNYTDGENSTTIIAPSDGFNRVTVTFNSFQLESCCDALRVYDGLDINAPLLGLYTGTTNPGPFTSNNPSGALTFWFTSDSSVTFDGWDATISCQTLSTTEFNFVGLKYYPNPVKDVFNVSYIREISFIEVYNILGQNIMSIKPKTNAVELDFSNYESGAYFVKIWVDDNLKIVKLIKE